MAVMPMFPLGSVLLPGAVLPLRVFEPRYLALVQQCLATDHQFGVVLIARGYEVGGGDVRTDVGAVARIVEVAEMASGRYAVVAVGTRRLKVREWLQDDPYPRADVEDWPDEESVTVDLDTPYSAVVGTLRRVLALSAELGRPAPPATVELTDEPVLGTYHAAALAPLGPFDRQQLLAAPAADIRLNLLSRLLDDQAEALALELAGG